MAVSKKYLGRECKHHPGHFERWISNSTCTKCTFEQSEKWRKANPEKRGASRKSWDWNHPDKSMLQRVRGRARKNGLEFNLTIEDIVIPEFCPVLGIKLAKTKGNSSDYSPTLDRINNDLGYIKGNVIVVSYRANRIKNDATIEELGKVFKYYDNLRKGYHG